MKNLFAITLMLAFSLSLAAQDQEKEVFIMGAMHTVSKFTKKAYKPLYKIAKEYEPQAIYIESIPKEDSLSIANTIPRFLEVSDSLAQVFDYDEEKINRLFVTDLKDMTVEDFGYLKQYFITQRDYANYRYYYYLQIYGAEGAKKPLRNENQDITFKLALHQNMKTISSMDNQTYRKEYFLAWRGCSSKGKENGDNKYLIKYSIKDILGGLMPSLFGKLGLYSNKMNAAKRMHIINSFRYCESGEGDCEEGKRIWDYRNARMVENIAKQVNEQEHKRNLVVVGAGHVYGMIEEFKRNYPEIKIKVIDQKAWDKEMEKMESNPSVATY